MAIICATSRPLTTLIISLLKKLILEVGDGQCPQEAGSEAEWVVPPNVLKDEPATVISRFRGHVIGIASAVEFDSDDSDLFLLEAYAVFSSFYTSNGSIEASAITTVF